MSRLQSLRFVTLYILAVVLMCGCADKDSVYRMSDEMLGTTINVIADVNSNAKSKLTCEIKEIDSKMKREMSIFDPNSLLSQINDGRQIEASEWLVDNLTLADSISRVSGGIYDVTVAPLIKAYGFGRGYQIKSDINIDSLMEFVGYNKIKINDKEVVKADPRVEIDLNSIAKGYAVDRVADLLERYGSTNYLVEIGGELRVRGGNPKGIAWRVGIETPELGNMGVGSSIEQRLQIPDTLDYRAIATSGNYRRFHTTAEGERIVHIVDPLSGEAHESRLLSVTVLAATCALADGYATMLMAAGEKRVIELLQRVNNCEAYLIFSSTDSDGYTIYQTPGIEGLLMD